MLQSETKADKINRDSHAQKQIMTIDTECEKEDHVTLPSFIRVRNPDWVIGNVDHTCVLDLVDGVAADIGQFSTLGDQHDVVSLKEPHESCQKNKNP